MPTSDSNTFCSASLVHDISSYPFQFYLDIVYFVGFRNVVFRFAQIVLLYASLVPRPHPARVSLAV